MADGLATNIGAILAMNAQAATKGQQKVASKITYLDKRVSSVA